MVEISVTYFVYLMKSVLSKLTINFDVLPTKTRCYIRYRSIITSLLHASPRVAPREVHVESAKLPWKALFPRHGPWLFHAKTRGISRHVAFPRDDTWHFHETSHGISTRPVTVESRVEFSQDQ